MVKVAVLPEGGPCRPEDTQPSKGRNMATQWQEAGAGLVGQSRSHGGPKSLLIPSVNEASGLWERDEGIEQHGGQETRRREVLWLMCGLKITAHSRNRRFLMYVGMLRDPVAVPWL